MSVDQWTKEDLDNALLYGVCLVCMTPQKVVKTVTGEHTHWELVRPCGHTEAEIDAALVEKP